MRNMFWISLTLLIFMLPVNGYTYNEPNHMKITAKAVEISPNLNLCLKKLNISSSDIFISEYFKNPKEPIVTKSYSYDRWLIWGSNWEDGKYFLGANGTTIRGRFANHFHNAIKENPNDAGLTDRLKLWIEAGSLRNGVSAMIWAENYYANLWTFERANNYFYDALTLNNKVYRDDAYAKTFCSLGQIMHLIQDMSVPAHVRNDNHGWTSMRASDGKGREKFYETYLEDNFLYYPQTHCNDVQPYDFSSVSNFKFTDFFDMNVYSADESDPIPSPYIPQGLAEYTSANFASQDTIFANKFKI